MPCGQSVRNQRYWSGKVKQKKGKGNISVAFNKPADKMFGMNQYVSGIPKMSYINPYPRQFTPYGLF